MTTIEEWRISPSLPEYEVSSFGRLRKIPHQKKMPYGGYRTYGGQPTFGQDSKEGRMIISYKGHTYKVHILICEAYNGPKPDPKFVCSHLDEDYKNNKPENLKWATQKENLNMPKVKEYHKSRTGENNPMIKGKKLKTTDINSKE